MTSPFPGMDPYLERFWGDFHTSFAVYARDQLASQLPADLCARLEEYMSIMLADGTKVGRAEPDVAIALTARPKAAGTRRARGATPLVIDLPVERPKQRRVLILDQEQQRVITVIGFLSPANKVSPGQVRYRRKRRTYLAGGASVVEIDLLRTGLPTVAVPPESQGEAAAAPYRVCVTRGWRTRRHELYPATYRARLPVINVPLRRREKDATLDLQALIEPIYRNGGYAGTLDYKLDPDPPLVGTDAA